MVAALWHVTLTVAGDEQARPDVLAALERLAAERPFFLSGRYGADRAELLAPAIGWRRALAIAAIAVLLIVPIRRARGEIPPPLPDFSDRHNESLRPVRDHRARAQSPGKGA